MAKKFEEFTYEELLDSMTGNAIMNLGRGKSMRDIVSEIMHSTNMWTWEIAKKKYENDGRKDSKTSKKD